MVRPPRYVRAININNLTNSELVLTATYQSGASQNFTVPVNEKLYIEKIDNQGSFSTVDPVSKVEVQAGQVNHLLAFDPQGVEVHEYDVHLNNDQLMFLRKLD